MSKKSQPSKGKSKSKKGKAQSQSQKSKVSAKKKGTKKADGKTQSRAYALQLPSTVDKKQVKAITSLKLSKRFTHYLLSQFGMSKKDIASTTGATESNIGRDLLQMSRSTVLQKKVMEKSVSLHAPAQEIPEAAE